jgi:hypothetical protein
MKNKYQILMILVLLFIVNSCTEDEPIEVFTTDISVTSNQTTIVWENENDLNTQINNSFVFNYGNININEIETSITINQDSTIVTAFIDFKEDFKNQYNDSDISNNTASINLEQENQTDPTDEDIEDEVSTQVIIELNQSIESELPDFDINQVGLLQIPVQIHIINDNNGNGGLNESKVQSSLNRVNNAFRFAKLEFVQYAPPNIINNTNFYNHTKDNEQYAEQNDVADVLNIYVPKTITKDNSDGSEKSMSGYAFFPFEDVDRIYVKKSRFNESTLEHEIGHYLSLYHTHSTAGNRGISGSGCNYEGDGICDTPFDPFKEEPYLSSYVDSSCNIDSSQSQYQNLVNNIMSYSRKKCRTVFTDEQLIRMSFSARTHRANLNCSSLSSESDLIVEEITLDDDGNGQYDINTKIKNIGDEATPGNEDIIVKYYINNQLVGDDTENPLNPNEVGDEALNNYQFTEAGTYEFRVEIEPVSNELNTDNNSLSQSFQISVGIGNGNSSDLVVEEITLDDDGNGQYDINTKIKNIGDEATPENEDIIVKYYINNQLVGDDTENPLNPDEVGDEALNNYQFTEAGTYEFRVEIEPVSNELNTDNNSLSQSFQISVGIGNGNSSDLVVEEITLDDDGNGQYDINTKIKNIGDEATPENEDIIVKYYINNQLVGDDTENPLNPDEVGDEALNNYQFTEAGTYEFRVEIEPVSNESNTKNNSLSQSFQISVGNTNTITPADDDCDAPIMQINQEYEVNIDIGNYGFGSPIDGEISNGSNARGFWLAFEVPGGTTVNNVKIFNVSNNFDPVIGTRTNCNFNNYLPDISTNNFYNYANQNGRGSNETFRNNFVGNSGSNNDGIYYIRIYHYYSNETPNISFKIIVE